MIIKNIFDGNFDEEVHSEFLKFGKGEFKEKYMIEAKNQKGKISIKTTNEFANYFVRKGLEMANGKVRITGAIVSTLQLDIDFIKDKKQFMGIKQFKIDGEIEPKKILDSMKKYPRAFFALSFVLPDYELKIKAKAPKSAKPSTSGKPPAVDFCSLKTSNKELIDSFFFDVKEEFKELQIKHTIKVNEMIYPKDLTKMKPEEVREKSKRKGVIIREIIKDGQTATKQANFEA